MLYVYHGEDELTRSEELAKLRQKLGDPTMASLNTTTLDGPALNLSELIQACNTLPFMADRRLVIVQDFWSQFEPPKDRKSKERKEQPDESQPEEPQAGEQQPRISTADAAFIRGLLEYLPHMPETTRLLFLESRDLRPKGDRPRNPVFGHLPPGQKGTYYKAFPAPKPGEVQRWIQRRMAAKGGSIHPPAAKELAELVGSDLRLVDQELDKLLAYVNWERAVTATDVQKLVADAHSINVFALVDAMGMRQTQMALENLHDLLDGGARPLYLLSMIERQFRILLQIKELREQGASIGEIQKALGIRHEFIIEKVLRQAQHFSMTRLEGIYSHLAEVEQSIKTGEISDVLALDLLVVELCL